MVYTVNKEKQMDVEQITKKPLTKLQQKAYEKIAEQIKKGNGGSPMKYGILMREVVALHDKGWIDSFPYKLL